jgi:hypothetical protein
MIHVNLAADKPQDALKAFSGADIAFVSRTSLHVDRCSPSSDIPQAMTNWNEYLDGEKVSCIYVRAALHTNTSRRRSPWAKC